MGVFLLSLAVIAVVMLAMAVGVLFNYPCLRGSCGGPDVVGPDGGAALLCDLSEPPSPPRRVAH